MPELVNPAGIDFADMALGKIFNGILGTAGDMVDELFAFRKVQFVERGQIPADSAGPDIEK